MLVCNFKNLISTKFLYLLLFGLQIDFIISQADFKFLSIYCKQYYLQNLYPNPTHEILFPHISLGIYLPPDTFLRLYSRPNFPNRASRFFLDCIYKIPIKSRRPHLGQELHLLYCSPRQCGEICRASLAKYRYFPDE